MLTTIGRRWTLVLTMLLCGIACVSTMFAPPPTGIVTFKICIHYHHFHFRATMDNRRSRLCRQIWRRRIICRHLYICWRTVSDSGASHWHGHEFDGRRNRTHTRSPSCSIGNLYLIHSVMQHFRVIIFECSHC
jgi:hypothetical protein